MVFQSTNELAYHYVKDNAFDWAGLHLLHAPCGHAAISQLTHYQPLLMECFDDLVYSFGQPGRHECKTIDDMQES